MKDKSFTGSGNDINITVGIDIADQGFWAASLAVLTARIDELVAAVEAR